MIKKVLSGIVRSWHILPQLEYRAFMCGNCHKENLQNGAYHHLVTTGGFFTPVHLCNVCEKKLLNGKIQTISQEARIDRTLFSDSRFESRTIIRFLKIIQSWDSSFEGKRKIRCDHCGREADAGENGSPQAYHAWWLHSGVFSELHLDKQCGKSLGF